MVGAIYVRLMQHGLPQSPSQSKPIKAEIKDHHWVASPIPLSTQGHAELDWISSRVFCHPLTLADNKRFFFQQHHRSAPRQALKPPLKKEMTIGKMPLTLPSAIKPYWCSALSSCGYQPGSTPHCNTKGRTPLMAAKGPFNPPCSAENHRSVRTICLGPCVSG